MNVRPLDVEPEPRRRGPVIVGVAIAALTVFGIWLSTGPPSISAPTTTAGTTTTTIGSPTTTVAFSSTPLRRQVPGFQGRVRGVGRLTPDEPADAVAWTWSSGESAPRSDPLPANADGSWDAGAERIAVIADSSFGRSLFYGPLGRVREVHNNVGSFAWHDSRPDAVAWLSEPEADGARELWVSRPPGPEGSFSATLVTRLDFDATLVGYGDWGFALGIVSPSQDRPLQLATYSPEGGFVAQASGSLVDSTADGRLLLLTDAESPRPRLAVSGIDLGGRTPIGPTSVIGGGLFSPNGMWVAAVFQGASGAVLWVGALDGTTSQEVPLAVDIAVPTAWSGDGRWILLRGSPDAPALTGVTQLLFVEADTSAAHVVLTPGAVSGLTVDATGAAEPNPYAG